VISSSALAQQSVDDEVAAAQVVDTLSVAVPAEVAAVAVAAAAEIAAVA